MVHFVIRTILPNETRHPYFVQHCVTDLARRSIEHFNQFSEVQVEEYGTDVAQPSSVLGTMQRRQPEV